MNELDESIKKQLTNPYNADDSVKVQRSFYVPKYIWEAAEGLPGGRPNAIIQSLLDRITAYKSEIPQLRYDVDQIDLQIDALKSQKAAKLNRIAELEKQECENVTEAAFSEFAIQQAIQETSELLKMVGYRDLQKVHYSRLQELSRVPSTEIKEFLKSKKFMPSDNEIELFFLR